MQGFARSASREEAAKVLGMGEIKEFLERWEMDVPGVRRRMILAPRTRVKGRTFRFSFPLPGNINTRKKAPNKAEATAVPREVADSAKTINKAKPKTAKSRTPSTNRQEYESSRRQQPERKAAHNEAAKKKREQAKFLGLCRHCKAPAIPGQTRCEECAEEHRQARRLSDAARSQRKKEERALTS